MAIRGRSGRMQRRPTEWLGFVGAATLDTASTNSFFEMISTAQLAEYIHPTIVRVRGVLHFSLDGAANQPGNAPWRITVGITVVTAQAMAVVALPIPIVDLDANWLLWDQFAPEGSADSSGGRIFAMGVLDSRAMRRIEQPDNASVALMVSTTFAGAGNFRFRATTRTLIKGD